MQHPGRPSPPSIQSVAVHLIALHAVLERNLPHEATRTLIARAADTMKFHWLDRPASVGAITAADVARARTDADHIEAVQAWARSAWQAWSRHHAQVRAWAAALSPPGVSFGP